MPGICAQKNISTDNVVGAFFCIKSCMVYANAMMYIVRELKLVYCSRSIMVHIMNRKLGTLLCFGFTLLFALNAILFFGFKLPSTSEVFTCKPVKTNGDSTFSERLKQFKLKSDNFSSKYFKAKTLGQGTFGTVDLVKGSGNCYYALKSLKKTQDAEDEAKIAYAVRESKLLAKLLEAFEDNNKLYLVTQYVPGVNFRNYLDGLEDNDVSISESCLRFYTAQMVLMIEELHKIGIMFRDFKAENLILADDGYLMLIDYGSASTSERSTCSRCGTPQYMAPEALRGDSYDKTTDMFSLGMTMLVTAMGFSWNMPTRTAFVKELKATSGEHTLQYDADDGPSQEDIQLLNSNALKYSESVIHSREEWIGRMLKGLKKKGGNFPSLSDLIDNLLKLDLKDRLVHLKEIKNHTWFTNQPEPGTFTNRNRFTFTWAQLRERSSKVNRTKCPKVNRQKETAPEDYKDPFEDIVVA